MAKHTIRRTAEITDKSHSGGYIGILFFTVLLIAASSVLIYLQTDEYYTFDSEPKAPTLPKVATLLKPKTDPAGETPAVPVPMMPDETPK